MDLTLLMGVQLIWILDFGFGPSFITILFIYLAWLALDQISDDSKNFFQGS